MTTYTPQPKLLVHKLVPTAKLPERSLSKSIGYDLFFHGLTESGHASHLRIAPRTVAKCKTGLVVMAPPAHSLLVCSRSGMASYGMFVANAPGVIDPDYTGELIVLLYNGSHEIREVWHEMKIAQLLVIPRPKTPEIELLATLPETERGDRGFGSTGD